MLLDLVERNRRRLMFHVTVAQIIVRNEGGKRHCVRAEVALQSRQRAYRAMCQAPVSRANVEHTEVVPRHDSPVLVEEMELKDGVDQIARDDLVSDLEYENAERFVFPKFVEQS